MKNIIICLMFSLFLVGCQAFEIPNGYKLKSSKYIGNGKYEVQIESDTGVKSTVIYGPAPTGERRSTLAPPNEGYHQSWN